MVVTPSISVNAQKGPKNIILNDSNVHVFPLTESSTSYIKQDGLNIGDTFTFDKFFDVIADIFAFFRREKHTDSCTDNGAACYC